MYSLLTLAFSAFLISLAGTPLFRALYLHFGWLDWPDAGRKLHSRPTPRAGGPPILLAYVCAFAVLLAVGFHGGQMIAGNHDRIWRVIPAGVVVFAVGALDDILCLKPWQKLGGQIAAAGLAWAAGVRIHALHGSPLSVWVGLPLTLLWLIACTNAFNLIDGIDGLATGAGLFATVTILAAALVNGDMTLAYATAPLAGALVGFLCYNFNPASVFLGDSGSLTIGFLLGCFGVLWAEKAATMLGLTAPLMALALPLADTAVTVVRRFLLGRPIFGADRRHIHHQLLERGFTVRSAALVLYAACGVCAIFSLLAAVLENRHAGLLIPAFVALAGVAVQKLHYAEFSEARRVLFGGLVRRTIRDSLELQHLQHELTNARTDEDRWTAVLSATRQFGFSEATFAADGQRRQWTDTSARSSWQMTIPLANYGVCRLSVPFGSAVQPVALTRLAEVIRSSWVQRATPLPAAVVFYHFLHPDPVVSPQMLTQLAAGLAARGWSVEAVCSNRSCRDENAKYPDSVYEGVRIKRLWRPAFRQGSGLGRIANAVWMLAAWSTYCLRRRKAPDAVVIGTDPPLSILLALVVRRLWPRTKIAHWCFDLYPEAAIADGLLSGPNPILRRAMRSAYASCDLIADIGPCMRRLISVYGSPARTATLAPWALEEPQGVLPISLEERLALFGSAPLALLYSGSLGRANSIKPVLELAELLGESGVRFAFTVSGNCAGDVSPASNITVGPFASPDRLRDRLAAADIHITTLKEEWTGTVVPSKFFGALAIGRPVLFAGRPDSAIARWIREFGVGWVMDSSNLYEIAQILNDLAAEPGELKALFAHCHRVYRREFSKSVTLARWDAELRALLDVPAAIPARARVVSAAVQLE